MQRVGVGQSGYLCKWLRCCSAWCQRQFSDSFQRCPHTWPLAIVPQFPVLVFAPSGTLPRSWCRLDRYTFQIPLALHSPNYLVQSERHEQRGRVKLVRISPRAKRVRSALKIGISLISKKMKWNEIKENEIKQGTFRAERPSYLHGSTHRCSRMFPFRSSFRLRTRPHTASH